MNYINIYSKSDSELGRLLSHFAHMPFILPDHGRFESVEGYWYWLGCRDDRLRHVYGIQAKRLGKTLPRRVNISEADFRAAIKRANWYKIHQHPHILELLLESTAPFIHYYVFNGKKVRGSNQWVVEWWERARTSLKEKKGKEVIA